MAKKLDPLLIEILTKHGESVEAAVWDCHGTWVVYHKAIERIAAKAGVVFELPQIIEANSAAKTVAIAVKGTMGERSEWSFGEASPGNNKNSYPYAMAEKRAKDRVVLKLVGLHGLAYSEEESDDFKPQGVSAPPPTPPVVPPSRREEAFPLRAGWEWHDGDTSPKSSAQLKREGSFEGFPESIDECDGLPMLKKRERDWITTARQSGWSTAWKHAACNRIEHREQEILNSMSTEALAEVPLKDTLQKSLRRPAEEEAAALDRARTLGNSLVQNYTSG
jgi:hypothetical protein